MNVKITLSVPLDEVEAEINNILEDCKKRIVNASQYLDEILLEHDNMLVQLKMLEDLRKKLNVVDLKLDDSYTVLKGYVQYRINSGKKEIIDDRDQEEQPNQDTTG